MRFNLNFWKAGLMILLLVLACLSAVPAVKAQIPELRVVRVYWGSDGDLQPKPGDRNIPLSVVIQNADTSTLNYLQAKLILQGAPFTSSTGALEAYAGTSSIPPGGTATLTFRVNVSEEAELKVYSLPLELTVFTTRYSSGVNVSLNVSVPLRGEVLLKASLSPWQVPPGIRNVQLGLKNLGQAEASDVRVTVSPVSPLVLAEGDGFYRLDKVAPSTEKTLSFKLLVPASLEGSTGTIQVNVSYQDGYGNLQSESKTLSLKVSRLGEWFSVKASPETVRPEVNKVTFTLSNLGSEAAENVEVSLTLPQSLSLLEADNVWRFSRIPPGAEASFQAEIYASTAAVGSAAQASLLIKYEVGGIPRSEAKILGFKVGEQTVSPVRLEVVDTGWGSTANPLRVSPGDEGAPFYVALQNLGSHTVVGVRGELKLKPPFTSTTGSDRISASLPSIPPGQTGVLRFPLDVSPEAEVKTYKLSLTVEYMILNEVASPVSYVEAPPESFTVEAPLYGRPILDLSLENPTVTAGETVELKFYLENVGSGAVVDLNVFLQLPSGAGRLPLTLMGEDNLWHFERVNAREKYGFKAAVKVGREVVGTYQLTFNLTYRDEWGQTYSEVRSLGLYVSPIAPGSQVLVSDYKLKPQTVFKGKDFTLLLTVKNTGDSEVQQVSVQLITPQGFSTLTPSTLNLGSLKPGEERQLAYQVKSSPAASEGVVYTFTVEISYVDEVGMARVSRSQLGVPLHGTVELVAYDVKAENATPGGVLTLTFTLLNKGTTTATYTSLSIVPSETFKPVGEAAYIGDLDPNAPLPVSLKAGVSPKTSEGDYQLKVKVYYRDEYNEDHVDYLTFPVKVSKIAVKPSPTPQPSKGFKAFSSVQAYVGVAVVLAAILGLIAWRRRGRQKIE